MMIMARRDITPAFCAYKHRMGRAVRQFEGRGEAFVAFRKAIQNNPSSWEAYRQLGVFFHESHAIDEAISCYKKALSLNEGHVETRFRLGLAYQDGGNVQLAINVYETVLQAEPSSTAVLINLGTACQMMGKHTKAFGWYRKAVRQFPDHPIVHMNMGTAYASLDQHDRATRCYEKAVALKPDYEKAVCYLYKQYQRNCEWDKVEAIGMRLDALTQASIESGVRPAETPFLNISRHDNPALNHAVARAWSQAIESRGSSGTCVYSHSFPSFPSNVIKIGYLSNTFCNHPGAQLILQLFGLHDRSRFEVYCYSYGENDGSYYRKKIEAEADHFIDIRKLSDQDVANQMVKDQIHILVDLRGFTRDGRLGICAFRPAPIQATYLGYPGTTGASFIDYLICDEIIAPPNHRDWYSEHLVYLPYSYQINDNRQRPADRIPARKAVGLPEKGTIFCSFNTHYKIDPVMFAAWMKVLNQVPGSVLWLLDGGIRLRSNLLRSASRHNVEPDRIVFSEKLPKDEHLARLKVADLALDTRVYGGHTTTTDALWAGLPVVALKGAHFASRVSSSILAAAGVPELVTESIRTYIDLAVELGSNKARLKALRYKILRNHSCAPLFDTTQMVRFIETAYEEMWANYCKGKLIKDIIVDDDDDDDDPMDDGLMK